MNWLKHALPVIAAVFILTGCTDSKEQKAEKDVRVWSGENAEVTIKFAEYSKETPITLKESKVNDLEGVGFELLNAGVQEDKPYVDLLIDTTKLNEEQAGLFSAEYEKMMRSETKMDMPVQIRLFGSQHHYETEQPHYVLADSVFYSQGQEPIDPNHVVSDVEESKCGAKEDEETRCIGIGEPLDKELPHTRDFSRE